MSDSSILLRRASLQMMPIGRAGSPAAHQAERANVRPFCDLLYGGVAQPDEIGDFSEWGATKPQRCYGEVTGFGGIPLTFGGGSCDLPQDDEVAIHIRSSSCHASHAASASALACSALGQTARSASARAARYAACAASIRSASARWLVAMSLVNHSSTPLSIKFPRDAKGRGNMSSTLWLGVWPRRDDSGSYAADLRELSLPPVTVAQPQPSRGEIQTNEKGTE